MAFELILFMVMTRVEFPVLCDACAAGDAPEEAGFAQEAKPRQAIARPKLASAIFPTDMMAIAMTERHCPRLIFTGTG
jgi:hypothetical protein